MEPDQSHRLLLGQPRIRLLLLTTMNWTNFPHYYYCYYYYYYYFYYYM